MAIQQRQFSGEEVQQAIQELAICGYSQRAIAQKAKCSQAAISCVFRGKSTPNYGLGVRLVLISEKLKQEMANEEAGEVKK